MPNPFSKGGALYKPPSGAGWGGEAKGAGTPFNAEHQPPAEAKKAGWEARAAMRARMEEKRLAMAEKLIALAETAESETVQLQAVNAFFDRLDGKPVQAVSGPDGEALPAAIAVRFVQPE